MTNIKGFPYYFNLTEDKDIIELYSSFITYKVMQTINEEKAMYSYAPNKWNIKQIIGHITDHERIKIYRAFMLSRNIKMELWGYDQEVLVKNSRFKASTVKQLLDDYAKVRESSLSFIEQLSKNQLQITGNARGTIITLEQFLKSIIGHEIHHINILSDKYDIEY